MYSWTYTIYITKFHKLFSITVITDPYLNCACSIPALLLPTPRSTRKALPPQPLSRHPRAAHNPSCLHLHCNHLLLSHPTASRPSNQSFPPTNSSITPLSDSSPTAPSSFLIPSSGFGSSSTSAPVSPPHLPTALVRSEQVPSVQRRSVDKDTTYKSGKSQEEAVTRHWRHLEFAYGMRFKQPYGVEQRVLQGYLQPIALDADWGGERGFYKIQTNAIAREWLASKQGREAIRETVPMQRIHPPAMEFTSYVG